MPVPLPKPVRPGDALTTRLWNELLRAVRATRILPGRGFRRRLTPDGTVLIADEVVVSWAHPFLVSLSADATSCQVRPGYINASVMPTIDEVKLDADSAPTLRLPDLKLNADGRGWVAVEVTCSKEWRAESARIVQVDSLDGRRHAKGEDGGADAGAAAALPDRRTLHPLALLVQRESAGQVEAFQLQHFNLRHVAAVTGSHVRHFFSAA